MIETLLGIVAGMGLAAWILFPLRRGDRDRTPLSHSRRGALVEAKQAAYRAILDLELDRSVGKVSEEDYRVLRRQHEAEALSILAELDEMEAAQDAQDAQSAGIAAPDALEVEIAAARRRMRGADR